MKNAFVAAAAALLLWANPASAQTYTGKIIHVEDGDSVTLLLDDKSHLKIRVHGIDAPEICHAQRDSQCKSKPGQPFGQVARDSLRTKALGKTVEAQCPTQDRYKRSVCRVTVATMDVGLALIQEGVAWHYAKYDSTAAYAKAHQEAKQAKRGLWAHPNPINPSQWRKQCWEEKICPN